MTDATRGVEGVRPYFWFQGDSVEELRRRLANTGLDVRVEFHIEGDKAFIHVVDPENGTRAGDEPPINDSHPCPPICPE